MILRRHLLALLLASPFAPARAQTPVMSRGTAFAFSFEALDGRDIRLADHIGRPVLIANTASLCGYTPQYAGLEQIWIRYRDRGLLVIGVPSNDFAQEPGGASQIRGAAQQHGVTFPLTEKVAVRGNAAHPFYRWAAVQRPSDTPRWNFHKYLVGRDGTLVAAFPSAIEPTDPRVISAIERQLGAG